MSGNELPKCVRQSLNIAAEMCANVIPKNLGYVWEYNNENPKANNLGCYVVIIHTQKYQNFYFEFILYEEEDTFIFECGINYAIIEEDFFNSEECFAQHIKRGAKLDYHTFLKLVTEQVKKVLKLEEENIEKQD